MKREIKEHCSHNFEYSHKEQMTVYHSGANLGKEVDVVICTKCGEIRRN